MLAGNLCSSRRDSQEIQAKRRDTMRNLFKSFANDESGATAIEYGLIAALLSVAIITAITSVQGQLDTTYNRVATELGTANQ
jgi:pilus assembly protein Flp/PilA